MSEHRRRPPRGMPFRKSMQPGSGSGNWKATIRAFAMLALFVLVLGGAIVYSIVSRGLSAHDEPSRVEEMLARAMRRWATPASVRDRANSVQATEAVLNQALEHYADHCATCHANDGSGDTAIGRSLYPKVPDMRSLATQSLTDGELFSIIEHGIRLTGMPGWGTGTPESERESWALVHFIRRLEKLSPADLERMERLNPKTADQWREEEDARQFLAGEDAQQPSVAPHKHDDKR